MVEAPERLVAGDARGEEGLVLMGTENTLPTLLLRILGLNLLDTVEERDLERVVFFEIGSAFLIVGFVVAERFPPLVIIAS